MADLETLELAWEFYGECPTATVDVLTAIAQKTMGWGGTVEDVIQVFQGCPRYRVYQDTVSGAWLVRRLT